MFTVPDSPSYRATVKQWQDYLLLLETEYAQASGVTGAIAEAKGVIKAFLQEESHKAEPLAA